MDPMILTLEFTRAREAEDAYAFATGVQSYLLREAGGVYDSFEITWDEALFSDLSELARPEPSPEVVARMGQRLREILALAGWDVYDREIGQAVRAGRRVVLDILSGAAELYSLPWELVPLRSTGQPLAALPEVLIRYAWPATLTAGAGPRPEGGRILFAWSDADAPVPWEAQEAVLREAVAAAAPLVPLTLDVLPRATASGLAEALQARPTMLHLLCHGRAGPRGGLVFGSERGYGDDVLDAGRLQRLLTPFAKDLRQVVLCACGSGAWSSVASPLGSLAQGVHRLGVPSVIAFRIPVSQEGATAAARALYDGLFREIRSLEEAHLDAQSALLLRPTLDWAALQLLARAEDGLDTRPLVFRPYRGLLAFGPEHAPFYFGRDAERAELLAKLERLRAEARPRLLLVEGASGTGKSSLVLAGVLPVLCANGGRWARMVPGADPVAALERALADRPAGDQDFLLVVDQLEEIFTQVADDPQGRAEADRFTRSLWALASDARPLLVLATLRADFRGRCGEVHLDAATRMDQLFRPERMSHHVFVAQMGPEQLREVILRPAVQVGLELASDLVDRVIADVGAEPGALPLLEYTLDLLWQRREGRRLSGEVYAALGGVGGALSGRAETILGTLDAAQRRAARRLLVRLVGVREDSATDTRIRVPIASLRPRDAAAAAVFDEVLARFVNERLLVRGEGGTASVEVAHEAILRKWETLRTWVQEDRPRLLELARLEGWARTWRDAPDALLSGRRLEEAAELARRYPDDASDDAVALIAASQAEELRRAEEVEARRREREERAEAERVAALAARRRARITAGVAVAAALVMGGLGGMANQSRDKAQAEAMRARDRARMWAAQRSEASPLLMLQLLREVEDPEHLPGWSSLAAQTAARGPFPEAMLPGLQEPLTALDWSPDGQRLLVGYRDGQVFLRNADGSGEPVPLDEERIEGGLLGDGLRFSPDGKLALAKGGDGGIKLWTVEGQRLLSLGGASDPRWFAQAEFSPNEQKPRFAGVMNDGNVMVRDLPSGPERPLSASYEATPRSLVFTPDGEGLFVQYYNDRVEYWPSFAPDARPSILELDSPVTSLLTPSSFSPDGRIALGLKDGTVQLWSLERRAADERLIVSEGADPDGDLAVCALAYAPDGSALFANSYAGLFRRRLDGSAKPNEPSFEMIATIAQCDLEQHLWPSGDRLLSFARWVQLYDLVDPPDAVFLREAIGRTSAVSVLAVALSPDQPDRRLATGASDGALQIWPLDLQVEPRFIGEEGASWRSIPSADGSTVALVEYGWRSIPSADGATVALGAYGSSLLHLLDPEGEPTAELRLPAGLELAELLAIAPDGRHVLCALTSGALMRLDTQGVEPPWTIEVPGHPIVWGAFWGDTRRVLVETEGGALRVLAMGAAEPETLWEAPGSSPVIPSIARRVAPDASWMVRQSTADGVIRMWRANGGAAPSLLEVNMQTETELPTLSVSRDGSKLVVISLGGEAVLHWMDGSGRTRILPSVEPVKQAVFSPDGRQVALFLERADAVVYSLEEGGATHRIASRGEHIDLGSFSEDGALFVYKTDQGSLGVHRVGDPEPSVLLVQGEAWLELSSLAFSPDNSRIIGLSSQGVKIWRWRVPDLMETLWRATPLCMDVSDRMTLLNESEPEAKEGRRACEEHVERQAHPAAPPS